MKNRKLAQKLDQASEFDPTIRLKRKYLPRFREKQVQPQSYSRKRLHRNTARGIPAIFNDFPTPLKVETQSDFESLECVFEHMLSDATDVSYPLRLAPDFERVETGLDRIMKLWSLNADMLAITDLHFRDTKLENTLDPDRMSAFNLFVAGGRRLRTLEMMTLMISTFGAVTESHSDDGDGSNHCFTGEKLWLVWDTDEGMRHGLEDCEKQIVIDRPAFDMETFLQLDSARWFLMTQGKTLFLPGHLTHKVVTLSKYIGVGSFYVSVTNILRTLTRWKLVEPLYSRRYGSEIADEFSRKIVKLAIKKSRLTREDSLTEFKKWGCDYIPLAYNSWKREYPASVRKQCFNEGRYAELVALHKSISSASSPWRLPA